MYIQSILSIFSHLHAPSLPCVVFSVWRGGEGDVGVPFISPPPLEVK